MALKVNCYSVLIVAFAASSLCAKVEEKTTKGTATTSTTNQTVEKTRLAVQAEVAPETPKTSFAHQLADAAKQGQKIAFIDSVQAMRESFDGQMATKEIQAKKEELSKTVQEEEQKIGQSINGFRERSAMLSEAARAKEEKRLVKAKQDFESLVQECEEELKMVMQKLTEPLARDLDEVVAAVGKELQLDAIIDGSTGRVVYAADKVNVTSTLVDRMNKKRDQRLILAAEKKEATKLAQAPIVAAESARA